LLKSNPTHNNIILTVEGLKKHFPIRRGFLQRVTGWVNAVEDVSFRIEKGKTLGLVGESGCGKTTVARLILKLLRADEGKIIFNGQDISGLTEKEMKPFRKQIQIIFQDPYGSLNPRMTIGQTLLEGLQINGIRDNDQKYAQLEKLLKMVGMSPRSIDRYPHEFSGGQRQRIGIARALSVQPSLVICDEPVSALDVSIQAQIINLLKDLQDQLDLSYLFISHDLNVVGYLCNDVAVMYRGQIMEYGPADALFDSPCHPYTHLLLSAAPGSEADAGQTSLPPENEIPQAATPSLGCSFQSKCPLHQPRCDESLQAFVEVGDNHYVRCWNAAESTKRRDLKHN
jgi:oligopeptide/dipeptide ABC transporter ATP-binding protein